MFRHHVLLAAATLALVAGTACSASTEEAPARKSVDVGGAVHAIRTVGGQAFVAAGKGGASIVELFTGELTQKLNVPGEAIGIDVDFILSCGWLVRQIAVLTDGRVHVVDARTFEVTHSFAVPVGSRELRINHDRAVLLTPDHRVTGFDLATGATVWSFEIRGSAGGLVIRDGNVLFAHHYPGGLKIHDATTGALKVAHKTAWLTGLDEIDGIAYATTSTGEGLHAIDTATGAVVGKLKTHAATLAVDHNFLVLATATSPLSIDVLDRTTLTLRRSFPMTEHVSVVALGDAVAAFGTSDGKLELIDLSGLFQ